MKKKRLFEFVFMPLFFLMLLQTVIYAEEIPKAKVMSVTGSTLHSLSLVRNQSIDMDDLIWVGEGVPWKEVVGKKISFQSIFGKDKEIAENRYGGLKGKILMSPHGWMQKYWVSTGVAVVSGAGPYPQVMQMALLKAEETARKLKLGTWSNWTIKSALEISTLSGRRGFQVVEGQVQEVRKIRGITYLNFGENWKTDFTAAISSKNHINFKRLDWNLATLVNKWVRVRGRVRSYNGPYMELIFPEQIEILE